MITNPHALTDITPAVLATMDTGLAALRSSCAELPTADAALLRRAAKMGLKSETFSREALELARQNPHLCPAGLDLEQAEHSMALRDTLLSRYLQARQLAETLEVAMQVCGVDAFDAARTAYKSMKANCRDAALLELIDHLGRNFRSRRAQASAPEAEPRIQHEAIAAETIEVEGGTDPIATAPTVQGLPVQLSCRSIKRSIRGDGDGDHGTLEAPLRRFVMNRGMQTLANPGRRSRFYRLSPHARNAQDAASHNAGQRDDSRDPSSCEAGQLMRRRP